MLVRDEEGKKKKKYIRKKKGKIKIEPREVEKVNQEEVKE